MSSLGSLQGDLECTAQFMLEGIEDFLKGRPSHLTQVYIVVLEQSVLEGLHDAMRDRYIGTFVLSCPDRDIHRKMTTTNMPEA